jgi:hypothetical protein
MVPMSAPDDPFATSASMPATCCGGYTASP